LIIHDRFIKSSRVFFVFNVHTPCDSSGKQDLCLRMGRVLNNNREAYWCVRGDFNATCSSLERKSRAIGPSHNDDTHFNQFINNNILFDVLLFVVILLGTRVMDCQ